MSKQSEAKKSQEYVSKMKPHSCMHCAHYESTFTDRIGWDRKIYTDESELRCGIGGFAIKKMGTCKEWASQPDAAESGK